MDRLAANQNDHHHGYTENHECEALILTFLPQVKNHFESGTLTFWICCLSFASLLNGVTES